MQKEDVVQRCPSQQCINRPCYSSPTSNLSDVVVKTLCGLEHISSGLEGITVGAEFRNASFGRLGSLTVRSPPCASASFCLWFFIFIKDFDCFNEDRNYKAVFCNVEIIHLYLSALIKVFLSKFLSFFFWPNKDYLPAFPHVKTSSHDTYLYVLASLNAF